METKEIKTIQEMLSADEHQDLRTSIYAAFLVDETRGANMIVAFAAERNITLAVDDVVTALNALDDEDIDIEMTLSKFDMSRFPSLHQNTSNIKFI